MKRTWRSSIGNEDSSGATPTGGGTKRKNNRLTKTTKRKKKKRAPASRKSSKKGIKNTTAAKPRRKSAQAAASKSQRKSAPAAKSAPATPPVKAEQPASKQTTVKHSSVPTEWEIQRPSKLLGTDSARSTLLNSNLSLVLFHFESFILENNPGWNFELHGEMGSQFMLQMRRNFVEFSFKRRRDAYIVWICFKEQEIGVVRGALHDTFNFNIEEKTLSRKNSQNPSSLVLTSPAYVKTINEDIRKNRNTLEYEVEEHSRRIGNLARLWTHQALGVPCPKDVSSLIAKFAGDVNTSRLRFALEVHESVYDFACRPLPRIQNLGKPLVTLSTVVDSYGNELLDEGSPSGWLYDTIALTTKLAEILANAP